MNKDELKEKGEHLKERIKEAFGDGKKKAGEFIDRARDRQHGTDKTDEVQPVEKESIEDENE
jgi:hypothetical protein